MYIIIIQFLLLSLFQDNFKFGMFYFAVSNIACVRLFLFSKCNQEHAHFNFASKVSLFETALIDSNRVTTRKLVTYYSKGLAYSNCNSIMTLLIRRLNLQVSNVYNLFR